ncbi:MAG: type II toxin-antitoxin system VapC family toxin [Panacagrimonas sp.]
MAGKTPRSGARRVENPSSALTASTSSAQLEAVQGFPNSARRLVELSRFLAPFDSFAFDDRAADEYAAIATTLRAEGRLIGPNDLMIAAIARSNDLVLVTHNTAEFARVAGLRLEDWQTE